MNGPEIVVGNHILPSSVVSIPEPPAPDDISVDMGPEETGIEMPEHAPLVDPKGYPEEISPAQK